jgi:ParB family chromosome partitioning protein
MSQIVDELKATADGLEELLERFRVPGAPGILSLAPERIDPNPVQPRQDFDAAAIEELALSLSRHGMLQPLTVRKGRSPGRYELVAGERRLRAAQRLGWNVVPCVVAEVPDDRLLELALVENVQRRDLDPLEAAAAYRALMRTYGYSQEDLASRLGLARSTVANALRLLELPEPLRREVSRGRISAGHARAIASLEGGARDALAEKIAREALTVREAEALARRARAAGGESTEGRGEGAAPRVRPEAKVRPPHIERIEEQLRRRFGTKVLVEEAGRARGRIVIEFYGDDDFERILEALEGR